MTDNQSRQRGATERLLQFLLDNGPQTVSQLEKQPFWGGVRTRAGELVKQGRLIRVELPNPDSGDRGSRVISRGFKVPADVFIGKLYSGGRQPGSTVKPPTQEQKDRAVAAKRAALERLALFADDEWSAIQHMLRARDAGHLADENYSVLRVGNLEKHVELFDAAVRRISKNTGRV